MIKWKKISRILINPGKSFTHASHPCVIEIGKNTYVLAFSSRKKMRSHIFLSKIKIIDNKIKFIKKPRMALSPSKPGYFDSEGLLSCCMVKNKKKIYLYYTGWQNIQSGLWHCDTGRAIIDEKKLTAKREFDGPIFGRDKDNPIFAAATTVFIDKNKWISWYNSGIKWTKKKNTWHPLYGIHYATSNDGIKWKSYPGLIIPLKNKYEHSFGRPTVIKNKNIFHMWFAYRGSKKFSTYRIGYAFSKDGRKWIRKDSKSGIDVSKNKNDWDGDAVTYPYVFQNRGKLIMLYNGNNYGLSGFGYAIEETD